jgi:hypothetical protein
MTHPNELRAPIELEHNTTRDEREQQYVADKRALEDDFHADLATIQTAKEADLAAAGFNPDGSWDPATFASELPVNTAAPAITGTATTGQTLTCSNGTWTNADTYTYQWKRDGVAIGGATANTRVLVMADEGHVLKCTVTAHNEQGTASADSGTRTPTA